MADTCIVCLGELPLESPRVSPAPVEPSDSWREPGGPPQQLTGEKQAAIPADSDVIAHIPSCGHSLHNDCLKPWVERANSCPICRQNFNVVELKRRLNGTSLTQLVTRLYTAQLYSSQLAPWRVQFTKPSSVFDRANA